MRHTTVVTVILCAAAAVSGCSRSSKGTVAALETDGVTVIAEKKCRRRGQTFDYVTCGREFRAQLTDRLCAERGAGEHQYLYRTGTSKPIAQKVVCK